MSEKFVYAIGAALVDTEVTVSDQDLDQLGIEKGTMTLVDESRQRVIKKQLEENLSIMLCKVDHGHQTVVHRSTTL